MRLDPFSVVAIRGDYSVAETYHELCSHPNLFLYGRNSGHLSIGNSAFVSPDQIVHPDIFHYQRLFVFVICSHLFSKLLESSIVMMTYVSKGPAEFLADFGERIALKETKPESLALIFR